MKIYNKYSLIFLLLFCSVFFKATTIPFELIDRKIIIDVKIKNQSHNFIFDSGAFTIISSELKNKLNEKKSSIIFEGIDANNVKSKTEVFSTNSLQISDTNLKNINFSFDDISWMSGRACKKISGVLGANMMKNRVWKIDFESKTITFSGKLQTENSSNFLSFPFSEENFTSVPKITANIRNQNLEFIFDTGSGMGLSIDESSYNKIKDDNFITFEGLLSQSINSISNGKRYVDLMEVKINNFDLGKQIVDSSSDARNLLGTKFMQSYIVTLDFVNQEITLSKTQRKPEYKSFGVNLAPMNSDLIIVNKTLLPQLSELNLKDKIIRVDNIDVSNVTPENYCEVKKLLDLKQSITLENAAHKKFTLKKTDVLDNLK